MWEASASMRSLGGPLPIGHVGPRIGGLLVAKCMELTGDVGDQGQAFWHTDSVSVHRRLPLTVGEMLLLPDGWLACPTVDTGGNEDRMTKSPPFEYAHGR